MWLRRFGVRVKRFGGAAAEARRGEPDGASSMDAAVMAALAAYGRRHSDDHVVTAAAARNGGRQSPTPDAIRQAPPGFGSAVVHVWYAHTTTMVPAHSVAPLTDDVVGPSGSGPRAQ